MAIIRPVGIESAQDFGTPVVAHAEPAMAAATAYDATVETEDGQTDVDVEEALVEQGFQLWWQQVTASPVTWMAQVFDAAARSSPAGSVTIRSRYWPALAERLLPHHPG